MSDNFERAVRDALGFAYSAGFVGGDASYARHNTLRVAAELRAALRSDALDELARESQSAGAYDEPATSEEPTP